MRCLRSSRGLGWGRRRMEWPQYITRSENDHFVPSARKGIANSMLLGIFISPSSVGCSVPTWGKQTIYPLDGLTVLPPNLWYYFLNPFLNAVASSQTRCLPFRPGLDETTPFAFYRGRRARCQKRVARKKYITWPRPRRDEETA